MNHWMDQRLKRWGRWYQVRMLDRSMGWLSCSPVARFGMPSYTGNVWSSDHYVEDWGDCEELNLKILMLPASEQNLLMTYYVHSGCSYRRAGRSLGRTHKTIKVWLDDVMLKIDYMFEDECLMRA